MYSYTYWWLSNDNDAWQERYLTDQSESFAQQALQMGFFMLSRLPAIASSTSTLPILVGQQRL